MGVSGGKLWRRERGGHTEGEDDAEDVEHHVRHCVLRERLHGRVLNQPAPQPACKLYDHCPGHDNDSRLGQLHHRVIARRQPIETLQRHLGKGRDHHHRKHQHANRLQPAPPHRVFIRILMGDEFRGGPDDGGAEEVEGGVDEGGEDGEGAGEDDDDDLANQEDEICEQIDVDGDCYDAGLAVGGVVGRKLDFVPDGV